MTLFFILLHLFVYFSSSSNRFKTLQNQGVLSLFLIPLPSTVLCLLHDKGFNECLLNELSEDIERLGWKVKNLPGGLYFRWEVGGNVLH